KACRVRARVGTLDSQRERYTARHPWCYCVSCARHHATMSSIDIFDLSTFSPLATGAAAGFAFAGDLAAAGSSAGALAAAGAAPVAPPARAAASMSATLIFERSTFPAAGFAAAGAPSGFALA